MKILITGSEGTLGKPLKKELTKRGYKVWGCDLFHKESNNYIRADIANYRQLKRVFDINNYDYVYHLAAEFGRHNGEEYYDTLWRTNVIGTRNILELQKERKFKLIMASSSEIYGEKSKKLLTEALSDTEVLFQLNDYAITKWVNELQIMNFEKQYGNECVRIRIFNTYGKGEIYHPYRSVICLFCYRAIFGIPWIVYKDYYRNFQYIDDFIPSFANVCENFVAGEVYNLAGSEYRSVEDVNEIILKYTKASPNLVTYLERDRHNVVNKKACIKKAFKQFGHNPTTILEEGIPKTIEWMKELYNV